MLKRLMKDEDFGVHNLAQCHGGFTVIKPQKMRRNENPGRLASRASTVKSHEISFVQLSMMKRYEKVGSISLFSVFEGDFQATWPAL